MCVEREREKVERMDEEWILHFDQIAGKDILFPVKIVNVELSPVSM